MLVYANSLVNHFSHQVAVDVGSLTDLILRLFFYLALVLKSTVLHNNFYFFALITKLYCIVYDMKQYVFVYSEVRANSINSFVCIINNFQFQVLSCELT